MSVTGKILSGLARTAYKRPLLSAGLVLGVPAALGIGRGLANRFGSDPHSAGLYESDAKAMRRNYFPEPHSTMYNLESRAASGCSKAAKKVLVKRSLEKKAALPLLSAAMTGLNVATTAPAVIDAFKGFLPKGPGNKTNSGQAGAGMPNPFTKYNPAAAPGATGIGI